MLKLVIFLFFILKCFALDLTPEVVELTSSNFDKLVTKGDEIWVVGFFAPWCGHCKSAAPEYSKAAKAMHGIVKFGSVNADEHQELGSRFGIKGFPTIKIFGVDKYKPEDYKGGRTAREFVSAAKEAINEKVSSVLGGSSKSSGGGSGSKDDGVITLTDDNFDKLVLDSDDLWLVEFYAPWCGHCKNLEPEWAKAARELKGKVKLGALDATANSVQANKYGVRGYPTIKFFPSGKKTSSSAEEYDGGRTSNDIVEWAVRKFAANVKAPEILEVNDENSFEDNCKGKVLCVISVLPDILDCQSECRNGYLNVLKELGDKYKDRLWGWVWVAAGSQPELEEALDIGGFGYPAMAVINSKKLKYSIFRGSFSKEGINEFLRDTSLGRGRTSTIKNDKLPKIVKTEPWDGKDGELPPEEDIDLSDLDDLKDEL